MTKEAFTPKGEEVLRQEIIDEFGFDEEDHEAIIDKMVERELKKENFAASVWKQKQAEKAKNAKLEEELKTKEESKSKEETKENAMTPAEISLMVAKEHFRATGGDKEQIRQIEKVMKATGKDFIRAQKDSLYRVWNEDYLQKQGREESSRNAQLPPSRGGTTHEKKETDEIASRNMGNLPSGFSMAKK